jgi:hypothetical protein
LVAELPMKVLLRTLRLPPPIAPPELPVVAFSWNVQRSTSVPPSPSAAMAALLNPRLRRNRLSRAVSLFWFWIAPPKPKLSARLSSKMQRSTVRSPSLEMAPAVVLVPPRMRRFCSVTVTAGETSNTRLLPSASSTISAGGSGPRMVTFLVSRRVPLTAIIESSPVSNRIVSPGAASAIACRSDPSPSLTVFTTSRRSRISTSRSLSTLSPASSVALTVTVTEAPVS